MPGGHALCAEIGIRALPDLLARGGVGGLGEVDPRRAADAAARTLKVLVTNG